MTMPHPMPTQALAPPTSLDGAPEPVRITPRALRELETLFPDGDPVHVRVTAAPG